jgi:uncharacterized protein YjdB
MKKFCSLAILAMCISIASYALGPISGSTGSCIGQVGYLTDSLSPGGTWSSSNTAIATVGLTSGDVHGVTAGTVTITYTLGASFVTTNYTVYPAAPAPITGASSFCVGISSQLSDATPGGTWSSGAPYIATVSATGLVTGVSGGYADIYYTLGGTCDVYTIDTINATATGSISGPNTVCSGSTITLMDSLHVTGGTWSSANTAIATIDPSTGVLTGVSAGGVMISYALNGICGVAYETYYVTVTSTTSPGTISGATTVYAGATTPLYETVTGYMWSSANTSIATIDSITGVVTGVAVGTTVISYTVYGCSGPAVATYTITVTAINGISGNVNFSGVAYYGDVKIWLITYNPTTLDLEAYDSVSVPCYGSSSVYYQFVGVPTDSYRVKAAVYDSSTIITGYVPTYHTASYYWYSANVIAHTSGAADINEDINMAYGTVSAGPGFIAGNVTTGANRGTSTTSIPVVGLSMNVINSGTSQLMGHVRTDASGHYNFTNLPVGATYLVFPDSLNYMTTAYTSITLTSAAPSLSTASFTQHTISKTITPNISAVNYLTAGAPFMVAFPNPANSKLNLQWNEMTSEKGNVSITDMTGREIYRSAINMTQGTGVKQIDLSGFANGLYMISVRSASINYNNKIQVQH